MSKEKIKIIRSIRFDNETATELKTIEEKTGMKTSTFIRFAIKKELKNVKKNR